MKEETRRLIVSLTSYPARIQYVPETVASLLRQTRPADKILLVLSGDQFPGREADLPEVLCDGQRDPLVELRWVAGDLKPHKKYYYAFREFPDDLILTVDDDVVYPPEMFENFWATHLEYPDAIVAGRTHVITLDENGDLNPYALWLQRTAGFAEGPSLQLHPVGVGGVLYDPKRFPEELYDEEAIRSVCLDTDDLWLKAMELVAGIPVVRAATPEFVRFVPGSQEVSLYLQNVDRNKNDIALAAIRGWVIEKFGRDVLRERLNETEYPVFPRKADEQFRYLNLDRKRTLEAVNDIYNRDTGRLQRRNRDLEQTLERTRDAVTRKNAEISRKNEEISLHRRDRERLRNENKQLNKEISRLNNDIANLRAEVAGVRASLSYRLGNLIVHPLKKIAHIPRKILSMARGKGGRG